MARRCGKRKPISKKEKLERLDSIIDNHKDNIKSWKKYIKFAKDDIKFFEKEMANSRKIIEECKKEKGGLI